MSIDIYIRINEIKKELSNCRDWDTAEFLEKELERLESLEVSTKKVKFQRKLNK